MEIKETIADTGDKAAYFSEDGFFASNERLLLRRRMAEDKENYIALSAESSELLPGLSPEEYHSFASYCWDKDEKEDTLFITILDKATGEYIGCSAIHDISTLLPELGIDILEKWQRKGIAYESLKLIAERIAEIRPVDYYLIRVYNDNDASNALAQKLGAVKAGEEKGEFDSIMGSYEKELHSQNSLFNSPEVLAARKRYFNLYHLAPEKV